jgi:hypothetical protein
MSDTMHIEEVIRRLERIEAAGPPALGSTATTGTRAVEEMRMDSTQEA